MNQDQIWNLIAKQLSGEASEEELKLLEGLLKENPDLHYPIQIINDLWQQRRHRVRITADNAFDRHVERMNHLNVDFDKDLLDPDKNRPIPSGYFEIKKKKNFGFVFIGLAAALLLIGFSAVRFYFFRSKDKSPSAEKSVSEVFTHYGSKSNVVLPDRTTVKLNAGSHLTYDKDYGNKNREVNLSGEAYFDVVKNKEKPFIIHTKKIDIKVLGTTFNVKSYPGESTETSLVKGSIEVTFKSNPTRKIVLKPNEKLIVSDKKESSNFARTPSPEPNVAISHLNYARKDSTIIETAWVQNKLVFKAETFKDLAQELERWYNVSIQFSDAETENLQFTGTFENETIQQALNALQLSGSFYYSITDGKIIISK
jgi:transmembrane sensor